MNLARRVWNELTGSGNAAVTVPLLDGALRPNQRLETAEAIAEAPLADNIVSHQGRLLFSSGRELRALVDGRLLHTFDADITCLAAGPAGRLAVGVDRHGVSVLQGDKIAVPSLSGNISNVTAMAYGGGDLIVCEGSQKHGSREWKHDLMAGGRDGAGTGSVWLFRENGDEIRLAHDLGYPNGVLVAKDGAVIVSESWRHRLIRLDADRPDQLQVVLADLPAYPARLSSGADGDIWLACVAPRSQLVEFVLREPKFRGRMVREVHPDYWIAPSLSSRSSFLEPLQGGSVKQMGVLKPWAPSRSYGLVIRLDADFNPIDSLHSRSDGTRHGTTSVFQDGSRLLVASKGSGQIIVVPIEKGAAQ